MEILVDIFILCLQIFFIITVSLILLVEKLTKKKAEHILTFPTPAVYEDCKLVGGPWDGGEITAKTITQRIRIPRLGKHGFDEVIYVRHPNQIFCYYELIPCPPEAGPEGYSRNCRIEE